MITNDNLLFLSKLRARLSKNDFILIRKKLAKTIDSSGLIAVHLSNTKSNIIHSNGEVIYCSVYKGCRGLFIKGKDNHATEIFGRIVCDEVIERLNNKGFMTSDELPNYGISQKDLEILLKETAAAIDDLVVIFAYPLSKAHSTKELLDKLLDACSGYLKTVE
jgi:Glu-tRNA(Gln) amidotransferase subunit E-like FAD-binding protein